MSISLIYARKFWTLNVAKSCRSRRGSEATGSVSLGGITQVKWELTGSVSLGGITQVKSEFVFSKPFRENFTPTLGETILDLVMLVVSRNKRIKNAVASAVPLDMWRRNQALGM